MCIFIQYKRMISTQVYHLRIAINNFVAVRPVSPWWKENKAFVRYLVILIRDNKEQHTYYANGLNTYQLVNSSQRN